MSLSLRGSKKINFKAINMFKNYFKTAFRNIVRHKLFSGLNIFGLAMGMACSILIFLWVEDEASFDRFNADANRIFRLTCQVSGVKAAVVPPPLAAAIKTEIASVKNATRIVSLQKMITVGTKKFDEKRIFYADTNFLRIFNYPLVKGNIATVLSSPNSVVITETTAIKYFGNTHDALGKTIYIDNDMKGTNLLVTGILKDIPSNSHLKFDMLLPVELYDKQNNQAEAWYNFDVYVYFQLKDFIMPGRSTISSVEKQVNEIYKKNSGNRVAASLFVQPLTDIHLHSQLMLDVEGQGSSQYVRIFSLVAVFIIIIACINFMNLATAVSGQRAKEVGLRKTIGALRYQLIAQFVGESVLLSFISLILALVLVFILLPLFNQLASKSISIDLLNIKILARLLTIAIVTGLISGSYPAFYLSSFKPVRVLKNAGIMPGRKSFLRNGLVVMQFSISVVLMISTLVIYNQLHYIRNKNIGFNKENLLYIEMPAVGDLKNNKDALKSSLDQQPDIKNYTITDYLPTNLTSGTQLSWRGMEPGTQVIGFRLSVDENFVNTFGMQMAAGRFFSKDFGGDDSSYIVNETAVKTMKVNRPADAIGKYISINGREAPVIGVVKDFNFKSVHQPVEPLIMRSSFSGGYIVMRTTPATIQKVIKLIKKGFHEVYGNYPLTYGFVNEDLSRLYITEQRMSKLFNVFSILSIAISCLGLFGLATFATQRRIKEIGVRKVLGAGEASIVAMLSGDFIKLVAVSLLVAFPVGWWMMNRWLDNFAYHISVQWWVFVLSGVCALLIALTTVSFQAIKAALANPVKSLRTE